MSTTNLASLSADNMIARLRLINASSSGIFREFNFADRTNVDDYRNLLAAVSSHAHRVRKRH
jgi:hypothetical protein